MEIYLKYLVLTILVCSAVAKPNVAASGKKEFFKKALDNPQILIDPVLYPTKKGLATLTKNAPITVDPESVYFLALVYQGPDLKPKPKPLEVTPVENVDVVAKGGDEADNAVAEVDNPEFVDNNKILTGTPEFDNSELVADNATESALVSSSELVVDNATESAIAELNDVSAIVGVDEN